MRANVGVEFCVLVLEPLQSQLLQKSKIVQGAGKNVGELLERENLTPVEIKIESKLLTFRRMLNRMKRAVHIPFQGLENGVYITILQSKAENMTPSAPHVIKHKPRGHFRSNHNSPHAESQWWDLGKIGEFPEPRFLCTVPPRGKFSEGDQVGHSAEWTGGLDEGQKGEGLVDKHLIHCCEQDFEHFSKFLNKVHTNQETLYLVIVEHADITSTLVRGVVDDVTHSNHNSCYGEQDSTQPAKRDHAT